jgi:hypothetical protein
MFSRAAAILLAVLALHVSAIDAAAQPRGGWGGAHGGGWGGGRGGFAGGGRFGAGPGGGWGGRFRYPGGGYPGAAFGGRPPIGQRGFPGRAPYADRGFAAPGPVAPRAFGGEERGVFGGDWRAQQDEVRRAVREGRHIPLSQAIEAVRRRMPGRELDAGLETGPDGRSVYRLRWAGQNGRRQDYLVDAGSGAIVGVQGGP